MKLLDKLKNRIRKHYKLYIFLRNMYGFKKGITSLLQGKKGSLEHIKSTISLLKKDNKILGKPINFTIEPTNACNLKCPICATGNGTLQRKTKYMKFDDFKKIIDEIYRYCNTLIYYNMGEPFLNKDWVEEVKYAKDMGISHVETCTNGDLANAQDIIDSKIDFVSFQIGGITQETHEIYRVGSNISKVFENIIELVLLKEQQQASWLHIELGLIVMKQNEHEVEQFFKLGKEMKVDSVNIVNPAVYTIEEGKKFLPKNEDYWIYSKEEFNNGIIKRNHTPKNDCPWINYSAVIHVDGSVSPCCNDYNGLHHMGNILEENFDDIWNGEKFKNFRNKVHTNQKDIDICKLCSGYGVSDIK